MSPEDIDEVTRIWRRATQDPFAFRRAVAAGLPGPPGLRAERADWILRSVSALAPVLAHPAAFGPAAAELIALRYPITLDDLAEDRDALLGALTECCGPRSPAAEKAWDRAFELFAEIVCAVGLDPFTTPGPASVAAPAGTATAGPATPAATAGPGAIP